METFNYLVLGSIAMFCSCSKNDATSSSKSSDLVDGFTSVQIDSIAKHYGWKKSAYGQSDGGKQMKVTDFIALMEKRKQFSSQNGRIEATGQLTGQIFGDETDAPSDILPPNGYYKLTWNFPNLRSQAYPSLYYMGITVLPTPAGATVQGITFNYDWVDGPLSLSDWTYNNIYSTATGDVSNLNVYNNGAETEKITIGTFTIENTYSVDFTITNQMMNGGHIMASIKIQQL